MSSLTSQNAPQVLGVAIRGEEHRCPAWNPKQPKTNGCSNMAIEILYIGNGCLGTHPCPASRLTTFLKNNGSDLSTRTGKRSRNVFQVMFFGRSPRRVYITGLLILVKREMTCRHHFLCLLHSSFFFPPVSSARVTRYPNRLEPPARGSPRLGHRLQVRCNWGEHQLGRVTDFERCHVGDKGLKTPDTPTLG